MDPFVPVPEDAVPVMLALAGLKPGETLVDLGSGDGRILVGAAKAGAKAVGVEASKDLAKSSRARLKSLGLSGSARVLNARWRDADLRRADVVALYLSGHALGALAPKFRRELREGARVVTFYFEIAGWAPRASLLLKPKGWRKLHPVYLYDRGSMPRRRRAPSA